MDGATGKRMMPMPVRPLPETTFALCLLSIALVPMAVAGIALVNTGLGRSHSAAHAMLASLCVFAVAVGAYFICGFAWQGFLGGPARNVVLAGKDWNWLARESFFLRRLESAGATASLTALLQMFCVGLAALIPLGAALDRWKLSASCASTFLLGAWIYPLFAHWIWAGGWLAQLGVNYGLGHGFIDVGGSGSIHVVGGMTALSVVYILGPRTGKYSPEGIPSAIPGHSTVLVLLGCLLSLLGWLGLNFAGAILFTGAAPQQVVRVAINTVLAACGALLVAVVITYVRFGRPDVSLSANGWVGGLVAGSAGCAFIAPAAAVLIGMVAGVLVTYSVEWFEARFGVDDPGGAISVHAAGGLWGLLAVGVFARFPAPVLNTVTASGAAPLTDEGQWLAQIVGIATLLGFVLPLSYGLNLALNRFFPYRVAMEGERQGMDLYELGAGAYPEFVTHTEDLTQLRKRPS
jgi:Amt family ammonium transporter